MVFDSAAPSLHAALVSPPLSTVYYLSRRTHQFVHVHQLLLVTFLPLIPLLDEMEECHKCLPFDALPRVMPSESTGAGALRDGPGLPIPRARSHPRHTLTHPSNLRMLRLPHALALGGFPLNLGTQVRLVQRVSENV